MRSRRQIAELLHPIKLLLATRNRHKAQEIQAILSNQFECLTLNDFPKAPPVVEDAPTFAGNATKKALELAKWLVHTHASQASQLSVLADDSGLEVDALAGAPGVHSARFAALDQSAENVPSGTNSPDAANNAKLLRLLKDVSQEQRTARFRCVLAFVEVGSGAEPGAPRLFEGVCEGRISFAPSGEGGFGYDPLFVPVGYTQSFAELGEDVKNKLSHRARALEKLRDSL